MRALVACALVTSASGFGFLVPEETPPFVPDGFAAGHWTAVTPDAGTVCFDGSPFTFFVVPRAGATRVVVHLAGGGACWDDLSCEVATVRISPFAPFGLDVIRVPPLLLDLDGAPASTVASEAQDLVGNLLFNDTSLADATYVYIPYCTQDAHVGAATAEYIIGSQLTEVHHNGWANAMSAVDWVRDHYDSSTEIIVAACSASAIAAPLVAAVLAPDFGSVRVLLDSFVGILSDAFVRDHAFGTWGAKCAFAEVAQTDLADPQLNTGNLLYESLRVILRAHPTVTVGFFTSLFDPTQMQILEYMGGVLTSSNFDNENKFSRLILDRLGKLEQEFPNQASSFVVRGTTHCAVFTDVAGTNPGFDAWAASVFNGAAPYSVACDICTLDATVGCDGVFRSGNVETHCMTCGEECPDAPAADFSQCDAN
ncbi:hypothetical protein M885DRAFT_564209 [Pelagophyceae sp. CCMP2097]|nr:hypothetical protein M885DRAFT_564209 [Pelagophyceae sp. CCMP2097]